MAGWTTGLRDSRLDYWASGPDSQTTGLPDSHTIGLPDSWTTGLRDSQTSAKKKPHKDKDSPQSSQ